ncbi:MAG: cob(I)yrinic acid a,c-diamide adenosyltransferase [Actinomycetia bacterium]|nr:cob(I)yrinic acid a,c-diamide adenosyltransferase [Actinomycetes bacterium]
MAKIDRITTKGGDRGQTTLYRVGRVPKNHPHIEALGALDELDSWLGLAWAVNNQAGHTRVCQSLRQLQDGVASVLNEVALAPSHSARAEERVSAQQLSVVEELTETAKQEQPESLSSHGFVTPSGQVEVAMLHVLRSQARRAERSVVAVSDDLEADSLVIPYLNRLSDCCFALAMALQAELSASATLKNPAE